MQRNKTEVKDDSNDRSKDKLQKQRRKNKHTLLMQINNHLYTEKKNNNSK